MNPQTQFCPNTACPARGQIGKGNIKIHSRQENRYRCTQCRRTFSAKRGTAMQGLKKSNALFETVVTLLAYGCPIAAIVAAFKIDVRTVRSWLLKGGRHCEQVHAQIVQSQQIDLGQVQADEIKVKAQGKQFWMAFAMMIATRLWLGGVVSEKRDKKLIAELAAQIRSVALCRPLLLAVDGLVSYVKAFRKAFRTPCREGKLGRPRMFAWQQIAIVQVVKKRTANSFEVTRRIVQGGEQMIAKLIQNSQGLGCINTAYIERLNATFRQRLNVLSRRTRNLARRQNTLHSGMFLIGCMYNLCVFHKSLRLPLHLPRERTHWVQRTPAIAAGLTDHRWSVAELFSYKVPPPRWTPPKHRGRPSAARLALVHAWCS
jgi:transposase-like protein